MLGNNLRVFEDRLRTLRKMYPMYKHFFDFYEGVFSIRKNISQEPNIESIVIEEHMINLKFKEGFPLLERQAFKIDFEHAKKVFFSLCDKFKNINEVKLQTEKIENYFQAHPEQLKDVFKAFLEEKELENINLDLNLLNFLVFHSLKPSLEKCAQLMKDKIKDRQWMRGYCPICGHYPYMAILKKDGKKIAKCSFCSYEWRVERIFCPYCGHKNHEKLKYFEAEEEPGYRIYVCEECKRYLKTIDEKIIENIVDLELEDIATIHLDILAEREGYKKMI